MEHRKYNDTYYIRVDKNEEIIKSIIDVCRKEGINSAVFSGIGGCKEAEIQTFIPESGTFETETLTGMLELVSLNGNIITDDEGKYFHHTHAMLTYKNGDEHKVSGGHIKSITVLYTAEIELRPVIGGTIKRLFDPETGTGFWDLK
ncbi:MAG: DUF296 domain-containing protein [Firmicutes bacterium]|nr:DUF296 domain-containing protein [Bacillota bacterium]